MKWTQGVKNWAKERNLIALQPNYIEMMQEEAQEGSDAAQADDWHEQIDSVCDQLILTYG